MKKNSVARAVLAMVCVLGVAGLAASALGKGKKDPPNKKIEIKACATKKPLVLFDHPAHVKMIKQNKQDCVVCHHLIKNKEPEKQKCSECHQEKRGKLGTCKDQSKKDNPFHVACIGCHKKVGGKAAKATKCKSCHVKK